MRENESWPIIFCLVIGNLLLAAPSFSHDIGAVRGTPHFVPGKNEVCLDGDLVDGGNGEVFICKGGRAVTAENGIFIMEARTNGDITQIKYGISLLNERMAALLELNKKTENLLKEQVNTFNNQLRESITKRFDSLDADLIRSPAIKKLREDLLAEIKAQIEKEMSEKPSN